MKKRNTVETVISVVTLILGLAGLAMIIMSICGLGSGSNTLNLGLICVALGVILNIIVILLKKIRNIGN